MSIFAGLKRRNVFRAATVYLAVTWLLIQLAETTFHAFGLGEGRLRILIIALAIGFVPAGALAWLFELTPEGTKRARSPAREPTARPYQPPARLRDRRAGLRQSLDRSRVGVLRRRHGRGAAQPARPHPGAAGDLANLGVRLQGEGRRHRRDRRPRRRGAQARAARRDAEEQTGRLTGVPAIDAGHDFRQHDRPARRRRTNRPLPAVARPALRHLHVPADGHLPAGGAPARGLGRMDSQVDRASPSPRDTWVRYTVMSGPCLDAVLQRLELQADLRALGLSREQIAGTRSTSACPVEPERAGQNR